MAPRFGVDLNDLGEAGWCVVWAQGIDPRVKRALSDLLDHRAEEAGRYFKETVYRPGESSRDFLYRHGATMGPADPRHLPYYIMLVGSPAEISYDFQANLDQVYAVGRIYFDHPDDYRRYADSVIAAESAQTSRPREITYFQPQTTLVTKRMNEELVAPLIRNSFSVSAADTATAWKITSIEGSQATKERLRRILGGPETPAVVFVATHVLADVSDGKNQEDHGGALVCAEWSGEGPVDAEAKFSAEDLRSAENLAGSVIVLHASGTLGSQVPESGAASEGTASTGQPSVSRLSQQLLANSNGGALAVIGWTDLVWRFNDPSGPSIFLDAYRSFFDVLLKRFRVGAAHEWFGQLVGDLAMEAAASWESDRNIVDAGHLARLRRMYQAARSIRILGDPAVRLPQLRVFKDRRMGEGFGLLSDRLAEEDHLDYMPYVLALRDVIVSLTTEPSLTIGIFGPWGHGKSSIMQRVAEMCKLPDTVAGAENHATVRHVSFSAWEYVASEQIWPSLVRRVIDAMEKDLPHGFLGLLAARLTRNIRRSLRESRERIILFLVMLGLVVASLFAWPAVEPNVKIWVVSLAAAGGAIRFVANLVSLPLGQWVTRLGAAQPYGRALGVMSEIEGDLEYLCRQMAADRRVLVTIDDLDRCEPQQVVEMLQAVKMLTSFRCFVVLLAVDLKVVCGAVESHYKKMYPPEQFSGLDYLDKIIQVPFRIPIPREEDVHSYLVSLTSRSARQQDVGQQDVGLEELPTAPPEEARRERPPRVEAGDEGAESADVGECSVTGEVAAQRSRVFSQEEVRAFEAIVPFLRKNPRHIKRLLNFYCLVRAVAHYRSDVVMQSDPAAVIGWILWCFQVPEGAKAILERHHSKGSETSGENYFAGLLDGLVQSDDTGRWVGLRKNFYVPEVGYQMFVRLIQYVLPMNAVS